MTAFIVGLIIDYLIGVFVALCVYNYIGKRHAG